MLVISNTSPLYYLTLIGQNELLPKLFGYVFIPESVRAAFSHEFRDCSPSLEIPHRKTSSSQYKRVICEIQLNYLHETQHFGNISVELALELLTQSIS
ncbi:predicted nucleic acid-binding protein [Candidatus Moduliflexus flocculans]|uniref:Predicted nucleic acid-binding protein n=1 Tax=Candidatus Moduliflexus flocculans TaxID=1499966 RepID=A0A0S6VRZ0_9BACT|nr:predicted nucleic acid-binding protein [Candidatus Moduliflexus flocculans]